MPRRQQGFTLLEVVIAVSFMAVAMTACMELFSGSLKLAGRASASSAATILASSVMDGVMWKVELDDIEERGSEGRFDWALSVTGVEAELGAWEGVPRKELSDDYELKRVEVTVAWRGISGDRQMALATTRMQEKY
jgi:prepilin-type N-terminal cleavage/methylation domain-containing protein